MCCSCVSHNFSQAMNLPSQRHNTPNTTNVATENINLWPIYGFRAGQYDGIYDVMAEICQDFATSFILQKLHLHGYQLLSGRQVRTTKKGIPCIHLSTNFYWTKRTAESRVKYVSTKRTVLISITASFSFVI